MVYVLMDHLLNGNVEASLCYVIACVIIATPVCH